MRNAAHPGRRTRRLGLAACVLVAVVGSSLVVWQSAYATFTKTAPPMAASLSTGTLTLADDDAGNALFSASNLKPGASGTRCIRVTANGSAPADVRFYGTGRSSTNGLAGELTLAVRMGGANATCGSITATPIYSGTLAGFTHEGFAAGRGNWTTPGKVANTRTYQLTWSLPSGAPLSAQGGSAGVTFVWEAQSR